MPALTRKIVMAPGKKWSASVSAHTRVLLNLGFEGQIVRTRPTGTWINGAYTYAAMDTWLDGGLADLTEREAAEGLAARYLRAFGPATAADLQWWTGWTVATTKAALADCGAVEVLVDGGPAFVAPGDEEPLAAGEPWVALLPGLDPTTMGWKQREWYLPGRLRRDVRPDGQRRPDGVGRRAGRGRLGAGPRRRGADPAAGRRRRRAAGRGRGPGGGAGRRCWGRPGSPSGSPAPCRPPSSRSTRA